MKVLSVEANNRRKAFEVQTRSKTYLYPYAKLDLRPSREDRIVDVYPDQEIGCEGFTYRVHSGDEDTIHIDRVLEYNQDPDYLRDLLLYKLTLEAQRRVADSPLSKRELIRRLSTSPAQFYRLLDQTNTRKSMGQLLSLLHILDCEVELVVREKVV